MNIETLHHHIQSRINMPVTLPSHITRRIFALLGSDEPTFCDAWVDIADDTYSGSVIVFTAKRVIEASFADTPKRDDDNTTYTVNVSTWSRSTLIGLNIDSDEEERKNPDGKWSQAWSNWPDAAYVKIAFKGARVLTLPINGSPTSEVYDELSELVTSLTADLS